jgi:hypothetical protein
MFPANQMEVKGRAQWTHAWCGCKGEPKGWEQQILKSLTGCAAVLFFVFFFFWREATSLPITIWAGSRLLGRNQHWECPDKLWSQMTIGPGSLFCSAFFYKKANRFARSISFSYNFPRSSLCLQLPFHGTKIQHIVQQKREAPSVEAVLSG